VPKELLEQYMTEHDPVRRFEELLRSHDVVDEDAVKQLDERIETEFREGYDFAQASPFPEPDDVRKGLWVEDGYWQSEPGRSGGTG
jgi:TPP-dependent pyruvate/acetoin dehydrogenase alpha subunit